MIISSPNKDLVLKEIFKSKAKFTSDLVSDRYQVSQEEIDKLTNEYKALVYCIVENLDISHRDLSNVVFSLSEFTRINFCNSVLVNSRLGAHTFETPGSKFNGCNFSFANLRGAKITFYQLKVTLVDETTILPAGFVYDSETSTVVEAE